jgi:hypothetical protein
MLQLFIARHPDLTILRWRSCVVFADRETGRVLAQSQSDSTSEMITLEDGLQYNAFEDLNPVD